MTKIIQKIAEAIILFEHDIYCRSNTKINLPLHKAYYNYRRKKDIEEINKKNVFLLPL